MVIKNPFSVRWYWMFYFCKAIKHRIICDNILCRQTTQGNSRNDAFLSNVSPSLFYLVWSSVFWLCMRATAVNPWLPSRGTRCVFWPTGRQPRAREQRLFVREMMRNLWWWCVVNQCGLEQLNKARLPGRSIGSTYLPETIRPRWSCVDSHTDSFSFPLVTHFHSGKSVLKIHSPVIKRKSVCTYG